MIEWNCPCGNSYKFHGFKEPQFDYKEHAEGLQRDYDLLLAEYNALKNQPKLEPVAYFNPQVKGGFYWAKSTKVTAPVTVSVEPMPLYTEPPKRRFDYKEPEQEPVGEWVSDKEFWENPKSNQEPVAWMTPTGALYRTDDVDGCFDDRHTPLYTEPPQRTWVGLTDEQLIKASLIAERGNYLVAFKRIQEWLKEKNT